MFDPKELTRSPDQAENESLTRFDEIYEYHHGDGHGYHGSDCVGDDDDDGDDDVCSPVFVHSFPCFRRRRRFRHVSWFDLEVISFPSFGHVTPPASLFGGHEWEEEEGEDEVGVE